MARLLRRAGIPAKEGVEAGTITRCLMHYVNFVRKADARLFVDDVGAAIFSPRSLVSTEGFRFFLAEGHGFHLGFAHA